MKQTLFTTAILLAVAELRQAGKFSAYDITRKLRDQVNKGEIAFLHRPTENVNGLQTYRVEHDEVKEIFNDLWSNDAICNLTRTHNGSHWEFSDSAVLTPSFVGKPTPVTVCAGNGQLTQIAKNPNVGVNFAAKQVVSRDPLTSQVVDYLRSRTGTTTTMKQIQSRFKGVNKTCQDYCDLLIRAGYIISNSNRPISQQTV